jgi:hypothetical protein
VLHLLKKSLLRVTVPRLQLVREPKFAEHARIVSTASIVKKMVEPAASVNKMDIYNQTYVYSGHNQVP